MQATTTSNDPLQMRIDLMMDLISQLEWPNDQLLSLKQDITILNSFSIVEDWGKVDLLIKGWATKLREPNQALIIGKKWDISLEIAIDAADIQLVKKLIDVCGKHRIFRISLPIMAVALEKQNDMLTNILLWACSQQKGSDDNGMLSALPEQRPRARQILFNRYCVVDNKEILNELFEDMHVPEGIEQDQLQELATEHRVAMISYLSRGDEPITITQDTLWNTIRSGNGQLAQLLQMLKMDSNFVWMESATPTAETVSVYNSSYALPESQTLVKDEKWNSFVALYAAYGGRLSSVDPKFRRDLHRSNSFASCRSRSTSVRSFSSQQSSTTSTIAYNVINSNDDQGWLMYLRGETTNLPGLSWMEPSLFSASDDASFRLSTTTESTFPVCLEAQTILQGLGGAVYS